ncbi:MAG TPA: hypothetical protein VFI61_03730 [Patescibacteria group bacterium]|nr:hypothetical protein [Patescibacteria group bacterium]
MESSIHLGSSRLLISSSLGSEFAGLLEQDEQIEVSDSKLFDRIKAAVNKLQRGKHFIENFPSNESGKLIAKTLRNVSFDPNLILGVNISKIEEPDAKKSLAVIEKSLGLPDGSGASAVGDRMVGRDFCVVVLGLKSLSDDEKPKMFSFLKKISSSAGVFVTD